MSGREVDPRAGSPATDEGPSGDRRFAAYLSALASKLDGTPGDNARAIDEIAAHLADVAAAEEAAGHDAATAAACALERIGSVEAVAARFAHEVDERLPARVALRLARVAASGLFALGLGALLARPIEWLLGRDFFVADTRIAHVTPARCFELMREQQLGDCRTALLQSHVSELIRLGLAVAVAAALAWWSLGAILARYEPLRGRARFDRWSARAGFAIFYAAGLYLLSPGEGAGHFMAGVVVAGVALGYWVRVRSQRVPTRPTA